MLWAAFILGLFGSLHCLGMCGPIAFMLPVDRQHPIKRIVQTSLYHFGRIAAYAVIGVLFGLLGKSIQLFGYQQQLSILLGALMILSVAIPQKYLSRFQLTRPLYRIVGKIKGWLGAELKKKTPDTFLTIGFLNGFLPCGLVYVAVFGALAMSSPWQGSLYMILFGLGTIPLMTTAIYTASFISSQVKQRLRRAIPVFVIVIGALFIVRGLGLGIPYLSPEHKTEMVTAEMECH